MSNLLDALTDNFGEIIEELNKEILNFRIVRFWQKINPSLTLTQLRDAYWQDAKSRSEFGVDLGVEFGKMFEMFLPFFLNEKGYACEPCFNSSGDMKFEGETKEIKTGTGGNIQGSTHSTGKETKPISMVQVLWEMNKETPLSELLQTKAFIKAINICVVDSISIERKGEHTDNNSRTTFSFTNKNFDALSDGLVFGRCRKGTKNVIFEKTQIVY